MTPHPETPKETGFICITCKQPILLTDEWFWLRDKRREPEHQKCYDERFAREFSTAPRLIR